MRHHNFTAFDEFVIGAVSSATAVTTSNELNARLGHFDQLAIMAVVDNIDLAGSFNLAILHSADGRNFSPWNPGGLDISAMGLLTNTNNVGYCSVPNTTVVTPLLSYVRLSMYFSGSTTKGHVRITVTQRDQGS